MISKKNVNEKIQYYLHKRLIFRFGCVFKILYILAEDLPIIDQEDIPIHTNGNLHHTVNLGIRELQRLLGSFNIKGQDAHIRAVHHIF